MKKENLKIRKQKRNRKKNLEWRYRIVADNKRKFR